MLRFMFCLCPQALCLVGPAGENYMVWTCLSISHLFIDQVREVVAEERGRVD